MTLTGRGRGRSLRRHRRRRERSRRRSPPRCLEDALYGRSRPAPSRCRIRLIDLYDEAIVRLRHGDFKGGRRMLEEVIRQDAGNVDAQTMLASAAYESGDLASSEKALGAALAIDPARADLRGQLARTLM